MTPPSVVGILIHVVETFTTQGTRQTETSDTIMPTEKHQIPLLADRHHHPLLYAVFHGGVNLNQVNALEDQGAQGRKAAIIHRIREAALAGNSEFTVAHGWNSAHCELSERDIDDLPPVVIFNVSLHGLILNREARAVVARHDPPLAANLDNQAWIERHLHRVLGFFANHGGSAERLQLFFEWLLVEHGVYYAEEMLLVDANEIHLFEEAGLEGRTRFWAAPAVYEQLPDSLQKRVRGIKLFTDGALGTRTAALHCPYRDSENRGLLNHEPADLEGVLARHCDLRRNIAVHAIGDRAIDQVVTCLEAVAPEKSRIRIEHAQFISEETAKRAKDLGVTLCMQPNFSDDSVHYRDRLPDGYAERNNPFRMLIDRIGFIPGEDLVFGSDGMPHGWRHGLQQARFPKGGHPVQTLTVEEFVAGYCTTDPAIGHLDVEIDADNRQVTGQVVISTGETTPESSSRIGAG